MTNHMLDSVRRRWYQNSSRFYLEAYVRRAASTLDGKARVLDAGAGECIYRDLFRHLQYESADFCKVPKPYGAITYECDLRAIPVEDGRYDAVICTQVLEHLSEPVQALKELWRVLKPGGHLWLSAPLFYEEHEKPHDYFRYTQFGLTHLIREAGFEVREMTWLEGYLGTLAYQFEMASRALPVREPLKAGGWVGLFVSLMVLFLRPVLLVCACILAKLDVWYKYESSGLCKNYCVIAEKIG